MKVLLINPLDREFLPPSMPPLGLSYVAASLRSVGYDIKIVDLNVDRENGVVYLKSLLSKDHFDMIGVSSIIPQYKKVKLLGRLIKSITPHTPLVMGGAGPTSIPKLFLENCCADIVCIGEGEETVKELAASIQDEIPLELCKGIVFKNNEGLCITTSGREQITDISKIVFPAWDLFPNISTYLENYLFKNNRRKGISILSTRGCPGQCNYCMCNFGRNLRIRTIENISYEIESLLESYNIDHVHFVDDTFITTRKRVIELCETFNNKFKDLTWSANVRADYVKEDTLKLMAASRCIFLAYGIESGSPAVLEYMKKGVTVSQASDAIRWTKEAGITMATYFIIGMPCETVETVKETVSFCKENLVGGEFFFATPIPGTELYKHARDSKLITDEDTYLEHLGEVRNFLINLTGMSNEDLFTLKENAEEEIKAHLGLFNIEVKPSTRTLPHEAAALLPKF